MASLTRVGVIQFSCSRDMIANANKAQLFVRQAAVQGAKIIVLPELFLGHYFCKEHKADHFDMALPSSLEQNPFLKTFSDLAKELNVVIPFSFFEKSNHVFFNTVSMIDSDGAILGKYRKSHIPTGPGYQEKFYFSPGNTGFKVFETRVAKIGVGICWDQWFPECARSMALHGAEMLLYPSAIGSEPQDSTICSKGAWQRVMQGHAAANVMPVIASNRVGTEEGAEGNITFYGGSFITDHTGEILHELKDEQEGVAVQEFDLNKLRQQRATWGLFRDRRPELYRTLTSLEGDAKLAD